MLLHRRGQTFIFCHENHISGDTTDPEPRITVTRIGDSLRPADHRYVASADLAGTLGLLRTAYARAPRDLGWPCAEILATNDR